MDSIRKIFFFPMSPRRQFFRLMVVLLVLFLALASFHAYFFYRISSHDIFQTSAVQAPTGPTVNEQKLTSVLSRYDAKEATRATAPALVPPVLEPSK